jgi:D-alanine-D-alanine ligase
MPGRATKYTPARFPAEVISQIQVIAKRIMSVLQIETFVRIDGFYTADGRIVIIDVNTISGMAPSSFFFQQAAEVGLDHSKLINALIKVELKKYQINF